MVLSWVLPLAILEHMDHRLDTPVSTPSLYLQAGPILMLHVPHPNSTATPEHL